MAASVSAQPWPLARFLFFFFFFFLFFSILSGLGYTPDFPSTSSLLTSTTLFSCFNSHLCDGDAGEASGWVRKAIGLLWWMHLDGTWSKVYERRYRVYRGPTCKHWKKYSYVSGVPKIISQSGKESRIRVWHAGHPLTTEECSLQFRVT